MQRIQFQVLSDKTPPSLFYFKLEKIHSITFAMATWPSPETLSTATLLRDRSLELHICETEALFKQGSLLPQCLTTPILGLQHLTDLMKVDSCSICPRFGLFH
jgi:hypothetical protein